MGQNNAHPFFRVKLSPYANKKLNISQLNEYQNLFNLAFRKVRDFYFLDEVNRIKFSHKCTDHEYHMKRVFITKYVPRSFFGDRQNQMWPELVNVMINMQSVEVDVEKIQDGKEATRLVFVVKFQDFLKDYQIYWHFEQFRDIEESTINSKLVLKEWAKKNQPEAFILMPCKSERKLHPKSKLDHDCKHEVYVIKDVNENRFELWETFTAQDLETILNNFPVYRSPCISGNPYCRFQHCTLWEDDLNHTQRIILYNQMELDLNNVLLIIDKLVNTNYQQWLDNLQIPLTINKTTFLNTITKRFEYNIKQSEIINFLKSGNLEIFFVKDNDGEEHLNLLDWDEHHKHKKLPVKQQFVWVLFVDFPIKETRLYLELNSNITLNE